MKLQVRHKVSVRSLIDIFSLVGQQFLAQRMLFRAILDEAMHTFVVQQLGEKKVLCFILLEWQMSSTRWWHSGWSV